jgi:hypothetical protein
VKRDSQFGCKISIFFIFLSGFASLKEEEEDWPAGSYIWCYNKYMLKYIPLQLGAITPREIPQVSLGFEVN